MSHSFWGLVKEIEYTALLILNCNRGQDGLDLGLACSCSRLIILYIRTGQDVYWLLTQHRGQLME